MERLLRPRGRSQCRECMAKVLGAWPWRGQGFGVAVGAWPKPWGRGQGRGGVAEALGAWPRPWELGQGRGAWPRRRRRGQGLGGEAKAVTANPNHNPNPKAVGV